MGFEAKYDSRVTQGATMVLLDADAAEAFPNSETVDSALRMVLQSGALAADEASKEQRKFG